MKATAPENKRRNLSTSWKVAASDKIARQVITIGGLATIGAVLLVVFVLISNVFPLFRSTSLSESPTLLSIGESVDSNSLPEGIRGKIIHSGIDEFSEIAWFLSSTGDVFAKSVADGKLLNVFENDTFVQDSAAITTSFRDRSGSSILLAFADGKIQNVELKFETTFIKEEDVETAIRSALQSNNSKSDLVTVDDATYRQLRGQLIRKQQLSKVVISDAHPLVTDGSSITHIAAATPRVLSSFDQSTETSFVATSSTSIVTGVLSKKASQFNDEISTEWTAQSSPLREVDPSLIASLMVHQQGNLITASLKDGRLARWAIESGSPRFINVEQIVYDDSQGQSGRVSNVTAAKALLGDNTILIGDQSGAVVGSFLANIATHEGAQESKYFGAHPFQFTSSAIRHLATSPGSRMFAAFDAKQSLTVGYVPNDQVLSKIVSEAKNPLEVWFNTRQDKIGVLTDQQLYLYDLSVAYPEASYKSFFQPMWYEGYAEPVSIWQSTSAGVDAEPKLSMRPLIFGTLKATFYSLLIAVPLALMAAVYSSEFLSRSVRLRVKPAIELMAGIPSVVLGFIAALVLASVFREHLFSILLSFFTLIFTLGLVGNMAMLLPQQVFLRLERFRTLALLVVVPIGIAIAWFIGKPVEQLLFSQSLIWWLDAKASSSAMPGWFLLMLPISMIVVVYASATIGTSLLRPIAAKWSAESFAVLMVGRYLLMSALIVLLAIFIAFLLTATGLDPRGSIYGSYQERNALLVGAILGFAIIPIIYTIAEDALQAVPQHLRSASLGCGATPWQTTTRIVLPTAMSGLFGGIMIGFGRAVGETMVVLMAAGNTPVMDVNPFNGYRTLSATLATELPEASRASTHFYTLFLAAFLLFCFTLIANTLAEFVRMRFRKRSFQL